MSIAVSPPSGSDTRSSYADWMELQSLLSSTGRATMADLTNVLDITDDLGDALHSDPESEAFDASIVDTEREALAQMVFDEIEFRARSLGGDYPFTLDKAKLRDPFLVRKQPPQKMVGGPLIYVFCLLASTIREGKIQPREKLATNEQAIPDNFQTCACLAAAGYVGGDVASFGWPRANGLAFLPALTVAYSRVGLGSVREREEPGMPQDLKDSGVDVIAWRSHPDRMPGKLYLVGQCASGSRWKQKSVLEYVEQLHSTWFTHQPQKHYLPAMFIPFTVHADLDDSREVAFLKMLHTHHWSMEQRYGLIFDRLRIAHYGGAFLRKADTSAEVDGTDKVDAVKGWVAGILKVAGLKAVGPTRKKAPASKPSAAKGKKAA